MTNTLQLYKYLIYYVKKSNSILCFMFCIGVSNIKNPLKVQLSCYGSYSFCTIHFNTINLMQWQIIYY